jgi:hypothetical protein
MSLQAGSLTSMINKDSNWETRSNSSVGSEGSVCTISGTTHKTRFIEPGSITQTGMFGTVRQYKEGSCIYGGFFGTTKFVTAPSRSPYVTPTSSPDQEYEAGVAKPPQMNL